jgi:hypothetical protein
VVLHRFPALIISKFKPVSCFMLTLDAFLRALLRNNGKKQLLIVSMAAILNKHYLCIF